MKRRTLLLAVVAVAAPLVGEAQQTGGRVRIGWLSSGSSPVAEQTAGFKEALDQMGYEVDRRLLVEERFANGDPDRLRGHALDLVRNKVHAIVAFGTPASLAAKEATDSIPIIILSVGDPVGSGLVRTLSKPGGNVTGVSAAFADVATKYVELLKQLAPAIVRIGFLGNAENPVNVRTVFPAAD
jgi:putative tryptophan/tyrosine transport system substrate-binding protein